GRRTERSVPVTFRWERRSRPAGRTIERSMVHAATPSTVRRRTRPHCSRTIERSRCEAEEAKGAGPDEPARGIVVGWVSMTDAPHTEALRADGRAADQLRPVKLHRGWADQAEGSVLVEFGGTRVLCNASFTEGVPRWR